MHDQARLSQSLLALVPVDGSSIGNQSLFEQLSAAFPDLSQDAFVDARDALIAQGVLQKGRGRGGSVKRSEADGSAVAAKPAAVKKPAHSAEKAAVSSMDDLKKTLWATADKLRANMDAAEYKHIVLGLIFLKYISDSFASRRAELERKLTDESDDYYLGDDDPELLAAELEDRDYYREVNVFWVPEVARWESIRSAAKQADIGKRIDDALAAIEAENPRLKNILDKRYARAQLPDGKLGELVDLVSTIGFGDDTGKARDLLGQVYEYFLGQFASAEGKKGGQFYTPASIVKTLVAVLNPHHGKVYDPCCGKRYIPSFKPTPYMLQW
jgi:type I restriction enzyme M protein